MGLNSFPVRPLIAELLYFFIQPSTAPRTVREVSASREGKHEGAAPDSITESGNPTHSLLSKLWFSNMRRTGRKEETGYRRRSRKGNFRGSVPVLLTNMLDAATGDLRQQERNQSRPHSRAKSCATSRILCVLPQRPKKHNQSIQLCCWVPHDYRGRWADRPRLVEVAPRADERSDERPCVDEVDGPLRRDADPHGRRRELRVGRRRVRAWGRGAQGVVAAVRASLAWGWRRLRGLPASPQFVSSMAR